MGELLIGTSGYHYPDEWRGGFYPDKLAVAKFLNYYSQQFNSLELNGTWYKMPTPEQMTKMIERSEGRVRFTVKAFRELTHEVNIDKFQETAQVFKKAMEPLLKEKLLLCVLFQFPESFKYENKERIYLDKIMKEMVDIPVVVEMRNNQWQNDKFYNALRLRKIGWCICDEPKLKNLMKLDYICTSNIAYIRFHGRNAKMWYKGDNTSRYDYLYTDTELQEFVNPIKHLQNIASIVQIFFNNHAKAQATINAKKIELLLK